MSVAFFSQYPPHNHSLLFYYENVFPLKDT